MARRSEAQAGRSVTSKVLAILEVFGSGAPSVSLTTIAEKADLPLPTAHRLVGELVEGGALVRHPSGQYAIGVRLWEIAQNSSRPLREAARPHLQDLFSLTGETVHLALHDGRQVLYIDRIYGSRRVPRASRVGGRLPLHATAVGKVILAYQEEWFQQAYVNGPLEAPTQHTRIRPRALLAEMAEVRKQGYARTNQEVRVGAASLAVPVFSEDGRVRVSIGMVVQSTQADLLMRHLPTMLGVAGRLVAVARLAEELTESPASIQWKTTVAAVAKRRQAEANLDTKE